MKKNFLIGLGCLIFIILLVLVYVFNKPEVEKKDEVKIRLAEVTHSPFYAPLYASMENGYFKEEGIDLEVILTPGADKVASSVLSNDVEVGFAGPESAIYVYTGGESDYLVTFAGLTKRDGQFIVSRNKDFTLQDLIGKEVLVGRKGGMPALNFLNALKNANIDSDKINLNYSIDFASLSGSFIGNVGDFVNLFDDSAKK